MTISSASVLGFLIHTLTLGREYNKNRVQRGHRHVQHIAFRVSQVLPAPHIPHTRLCRIQSQLAEGDGYVGRSGWWRWLDPAPGVSGQASVGIKSAKIPSGCRACVREPALGPSFARQSPDKLCALFVLRACGHLIIVLIALSLHSSHGNSS